VKGQVHGTQKWSGARGGGKSFETNFEAPSHMWLGKNAMRIDGPLGAQRVRLDKVTKHEDRGKQKACRGKNGK